MVALLHQTFLLAIFAFGTTSSQCSTTFGDGGSKRVFIFIIISCLHLSQGLHPGIAQLGIFLPHVLVLLIVVFVRPLHIQDGRGEDNKHAYSLPIGSELVPQFRDNVSRGRLVGILDECCFLERCQEL